MPFLMSVPQTHVGFSLLANKLCYVVALEDLEILQCSPSLEDDFAYIDFSIRFSNGHMRHSIPDCSQIIELATEIRSYSYGPVSEPEALTFDCADCNQAIEYEKSDEEYLNNDHDRICADCESDYAMCNGWRCAERLQLDELTVWDRDYYCSDCIDSVAPRCEGCDGRVGRDDTYCVNGDTYCQSCYSDRFFYCEGCSSECEQSDYCCDGQCTECCDCSKGSRLIHDYNYKPTPSFFGISSEIHYGVELEVNSTDIGTHAEYTIDALEESHAYLKEDGSIGVGFEIVTHPHTLQAHRELWTDFFNSVPRGMTSYKSGRCGMHVHIERSRLSEMQIRRMLVFLNAPANQGYVETIAQRPSNHYAEISEKKLTDEFSTDRYEALNVTNRHTVELRIFRGSVRKDRFFKNLEFTAAIVEFCRNTTYAQLTVHSFLTFVAKRRSSFKYLFNFHVERGLISAKALPTNKQSSRDVFRHEEVA